MNILQTQVALRDRPLVDVLDLSVRFLATHVAVYARLSLMVLLPAFGLSWAIGSMFGWWWGWTATLTLSLFAQAPFTALASKLMFDENVRALDAFTESSNALPRLIFARLLQTIVVVSGFLFLILPAAWMGAGLLFVPEVVVLEKGSGIPALLRAQRVLSGQFGDAMLGFLLLLMLFVAAPFLGDAVGHAILEDILEIQAPDAFTVTGGGALPLLGFWLFVPFLATARFLIYINLRTRVEGWDIQTRFAAIVAHASDDESEVRT
jgi:hypothetical protein